MDMKTKFGFSLIEMIITMGILVMLTVGSLGIYSNYSKNVELDASVGSIISDLKSAQSKSINGQEDLKWGIHFVNPPAGASDYYEIFSTATDYSTASVKTKVYLANGVTFSQPPEGFNQDVIYGKINGTINGDTMVKVVSGGTEKIINITALGNIY